MERLRISGRIRRVGNSFAVLIRKAEARRGRLEAGERVELDVIREPVEPLGLLKHLPYEPFRREPEGRDRH